MKIVVSYLNSVFRIEVKTKSNDKFLNFVFQFIINTKWHLGYTDSPDISTLLWHSDLREISLVKLK